MNTSNSPSSALPAVASHRATMTPGAAAPHWNRPPRILFASVFGPYAQDDEFGSRKINPMELYHNQVTRMQGPFSLRMFHRSWGLMLLRENIEAPATLLDFPTRERFIEELRAHRYEIVAISAIPPNLGKVIEMGKLIRHYAPGAIFILGGHIAGVPQIKERSGADHVVRGEGIRWLREFRGENPDAPIRHPRIQSGIGSRAMGLSLDGKRGEIAATLIPSVGCPMGCNFCATSAAFGGRGKFVNFYETGDELFEVMCGLEADMNVQSFFVMDENFLLHKKRALRLLELMEKSGKSWSLYVFSSANVLKSYSIDELVRLGISWVWMGLEGKASQYQKLAGADTMDVVRTMQEHGISILGSTIIGLEEHTPENLEEALDYAIAHRTEFHQFMLYTPVPGTPLYEEHRAAGTLLDPEAENLADAHGQLQFMHQHRHIPPGQETAWLHRAFQRDFEVNGPSIIRMAATALRGWKRYGRSHDARIRARFQREARMLPIQYAAVLAGAKIWFRNQPKLRNMAQEGLENLIAEFGWRSRLAAAFGGWFVARKIRLEAHRMENEAPIEPPTFYEPAALPA